MALQHTRRMPARALLLQRLGVWGRTLPARLWQWYLHRRTLAALARLDDRLLRDIGVSRVQAADEVAQPYWRVGGDGLPRDWR